MPGHQPYANVESREAAQWRRCASSDRRQRPVSYQRATKANKTPANQADFPLYERAVGWPEAFVAAAPPTRHHTLGVMHLSRRREVRPQRGMAFAPSYRAKRRQQLPCGSMIGTFRPSSAPSEVADLQGNRLERRGPTRLGAQTGSSGYCRRMSQVRGGRRLWGRTWARVACWEPRTKRPAGSGSLQAFGYRGRSSRGSRAVKARSRACSRSAQRTDQHWCRRGTSRFFEGNRSWG
jgi:hypothetical protein